MQINHNINTIIQFFITKKPFFVLLNTNMNNTPININNDLMNKIKYRFSYTEESNILE